MQCGNNRWSLLSKRAVTVNEGESVKEAEACPELCEQELITVSCMHSIQIESRDNKVLEIIIRIMRAYTGNQSIDETAPAFLDAVESVVNQRITIYTFVNVMVFSIALLRSYRDVSPSSWEDITV